MSDLVFIENNRPVTDSLTVADAFEKNHPDVLRDIRNLGCSEQFRLSNFAESSYTNQQGRQMPKFIMTEQGFTLLAMGYTGQHAMEFKERYIADFDRMRKQLTYRIVIPQSLPEALRLAADLAEKNEALKLQNAQKEQMINELQPKATYYDLVLQNKTTVPVTRIAKDYGMSGKAMNNLLHELKVQFKQGECWLLYQNYADKGYTQSKTHVIDSEKSSMHTYWTQKGRLFIYDLLKSQKDLLPIIERENKVLAPV